MSEYIDREAIQKRLNRIVEVNNLRTDLAWFTPYGVNALIEEIPAADVRPVPEGGIGEMSDGYHTFNGLYYQRMVLFSALVNAHNDRAWKSWKHEDGEACFGGGWFIVGIDTPQGGYTYHYEDKYWNWFECEELPVARHWDGHTEEDVTRLLSLPDVRPVVRGKWVKARGSWCTPGGDPVWECSECGKGRHVYGIEHGSYGADVADGQWVACPNCGADMREPQKEET